MGRGWRCDGDAVRTVQGCDWEAMGMRQGCDGDATGVQRGSDGGDGDATSLIILLEDSYTSRII